MLDFDKLVRQLAAENDAVRIRLSKGQKQTEMLEQQTAEQLRRFWSRAAEQPDEFSALMNDLQAQRDAIRQTEETVEALRRQLQKKSEQQNAEFAALMSELQAKKEDRLQEKLLHTFCGMLMQKQYAERADLLRNQLRFVQDAIGQSTEYAGEYKMLQEQLEELQSALLEKEETYTARIAELEGDLQSAKDALREAEMKAAMLGKMLEECQQKNGKLLQQIYQYQLGEEAARMFN